MFAVLWESVSAAIRERPNPTRTIALLQYLMMGSVLGAISGFVFPHRFSNQDGISLLGVALNTLLAGALASAYGRARARTSKRTTKLATFWGAAWFAFGLSAARLVVLIGFWHR